MLTAAGSPKGGGRGAQISGALIDNSLAVRLAVGELGVLYGRGRSFFRPMRHRVPGSRVAELACGRRLSRRCLRSCELQVHYGIAREAGRPGRHPHLAKELWFSVKWRSAPTVLFAMSLRGLAT